MRVRVTVPAVVACLASMTAGCSAAGSTEPGAAATPAPPVTSATPSPSTTPTSTPTPTPTPEPPHPVSMEALAQASYDGGDLQVGEVLDRNNAYTRYFVTYRSSGLRVSGVMNVPAGDGPFPSLVLNHGYIDPAVYTNGRGLRREQDYLARAGFVVLHTDYRNHAQSDDDSGNDLRLRLGYAEDAINAVLALRGSGLPYVDGGRIGMLGRSMGGGVTYQALVAQPGLVDAAVVYAPVSSDAVDNFDRWTRGQAERRALADEVVAAYGAPEDAPEFWREVSPRTYFDRVTEPVLIHHGTADESCPIAWSEETYEAMVAAGVDAELLVYDGEPHAFEAAWPLSMERTVAFFREHLVARG
ncbi:MAG TPA: prolyl oligopeptidase family serine peptidase [Jiangellales bacterium]|nr:prolyl oligopeptidase family serine peptidase [Jiangellales bacterium]